MESCGHIRRCVANKIFKADPALRTAALTEVKKRMKPFCSAFSVFVYMSDDKVRQVIHICDDCIEYFARNQNFIFIPSEKYLTLIECHKKGEIHPESTRLLAPEDGCIASVYVKR